MPEQASACTAGTLGGVAYAGLVLLKTSCSIPSVILFLAKHLRRYICVSFSKAIGSRGEVFK